MLSKTVKTRKSATSPQIETQVTVDFSGVSQEQMERLASATVIIDEQAVWRAGTIPSKATIKVAEQLARPRGIPFQPTVENMAAKATKMTPEEVKKLIANLQVALNNVKK